MSRKYPPLDPIHVQKFGMETNRVRIYARLHPNCAGLDYEYSTGISPLNARFDSNNDNNDENDVDMKFTDHTKTLIFDRSLPLSSKLIRKVTWIDQLDLAFSQVPVPVPYRPSQDILSIIADYYMPPIVCQIPFKPWEESSDSNQHRFFPDVMPLITEADVVLYHIGYLDRLVPGQGDGETRYEKRWYTTLTKIPDFVGILMETCPPMYLDPEVVDLYPKSPAELPLLEKITHALVDAQITDFSFAVFKSIDYVGLFQEGNTPLVHGFRPLDFCATRAWDRLHECRWIYAHGLRIVVLTLDAESG